MKLDLSVDCCYPKRNVVDLNDWALLQEVALDQEETAFLLANTAKIEDAVKAWKEALPGVKPMHEVFSNSSSFVLKTVNSLGSGFICQSKDEIKAVVESGIQPQEIILKSDSVFAPNVKFAAKHKVGKVAFASAGDLKKIKRAYPGAKLLLTIDYAKRDESCLDLLRLARELDMEVVGVSFDNEWSSECYPELTCAKKVAMAKLAFTLGNSLGHTNMTILDIGVPRVDRDELNMLTSTLKEQFGTYFKNIELVGHAQASFVTSAFKLAVKIVGKRIARNDPSGLRSYVLNEGVFGCFGRVLMDEKEPVPCPTPLDDMASKVNTEESDDSKFPSDLWGPTGDDMDLIGRRFPLRDLDVGEWLIFENIGAYFMAPGAISTKLQAFSAMEKGFGCSDDKWLLLRHALNGPSTEESCLSSSSPSWNDTNIFQQLPFSSLTVTFDHSEFLAEPADRSHTLF